MSLAVGVEKVVSQAAAVDGMLYLFGNVGLVGRQEKVVAATAKLFQPMIFQGYFRVVGEPKEGAKPQRFIV